ncbi:MAG: S1-like domain-containing RNA-binding protein [Desulfuromonadaceae bacterium]
MLHVGRWNSLPVALIDPAGAHFRLPQGELLLPTREVPPGCQVGDRLEVFVYPKSGDELAVTLRKPLAQVGEFAYLKVVQVSRVGVFLDWGLEKDLLVPYSEQPERMRLGRKYLVKLCFDNRQRIVATARIDQCLEPPPADLQAGDQVALLLWAFTDLGAKMIINDLYAGLLYRDELRSGLHCGSRLTGYIKCRREDGKVDLTLRRVGRDGVADAQQGLLAALSVTGMLPLHDGSPPELIREQLGMSKKTFKKAVGGLYRAGRIELLEDGIRLKKS